MTCDNWFENWFDTSYYHLLYNKRDDGEAAHFMDALVKFLEPSAKANFLDLACGKGRHSIYLNKKGFSVTGIDLSNSSIQFAKQFESDSLRFIEHDMRQTLEGMSFDFVLNLFTSFGYFTDIADDEKVIENVVQCLKPNGIFVLDYFNIQKSNLIIETQYTQVIHGVEFEIEKKIEDNRIIKQIIVNDKGTRSVYSEAVRIYNLEQFKQLLANHGLTLMHTFGNYKLEAFDAANSERLILIAGK